MEVLDEDAQHRLLVREVVVEGAAGEIRAADDVPNGSGAVSQLAEHLPGRLQDRVAVADRVLPALAGKGTLSGAGGSGSLPVHAASLSKGRGGR
jgi:hypothetical protein